MSARLDAIGNVVGRYEGAQPGLPALMFGSHFDSVRNGGRYDGDLGVIAPIACVDALHRAGRRLPFAVEVVAFADGKACASRRRCSAARRSPAPSTPGCSGSCSTSGDRSRKLRRHMPSRNRISVHKQNFVSLDVKNSYQEFTNDERQVQLYQNDLLPQAQEVYRSAATSYEAGEITYIEFLQARQTLISARSSYIDALYHYNAALARLEKAVGRPIAE